MKKKLVMTSSMAALALVPNGLAYAGDSVSEINEILNQCVPGKLCLFEKSFLSDLEVDLPDEDWVKEEFGSWAKKGRLKLKFSAIRYVQGNVDRLEYEVLPYWVSDSGREVADHDYTFFIKQIDENEYEIYDCDSTQRCFAQGPKAGIKFFSTTGSGDVKIVFTSDLYGSYGEENVPKFFRVGSFFKQGMKFTFQK